MEFYSGHDIFNEYPTVGHTFLLNVLFRSTFFYSMSAAGHGQNP